MLDARLLRLQIDELYGEIDDELDLVVADYLPVGRTAEQALAEMAELSDDEALDLRAVAGTLARDVDHDDLSQEIAPRGLRFLRRVKRLPDETAIELTAHFGELAKLQRATIADLIVVDGVDEQTARAVRDTLTRLTESTILDQY